MSECRLRLTEAEYNNLKDLSYKEVNEWVKGQMPDSVLCGYGYYGCSMPMLDDDRKPFILYRTGSSCD